MIRTLMAATALATLASPAFAETIPVAPGEGAQERLQVLIPIVFFLVFILLYMTFHSVSEAVIVTLSVVYAMTGGVILQWWLGYNFSVAVWVG